MDSCNSGSGKSIMILCSAIIEEIKHIRKSRSALVAYYYFDFKDAAKRDVRGLLTSLLLQLVDDSDPCWDLLSQLHKTGRDGSDQPSVAVLAHLHRVVFAFTKKMVKWKTSIVLSASSS